MADKNQMMDIRALKLYRTGKQRAQTQLATIAGNVTMNLKKKSTVREEERSYRRGR